MKTTLATLLLLVALPALPVMAEEKLTGVARQEPSAKPYTTKFSIAAGDKRYPVMIAAGTDGTPRLKLIESSIQKTEATFTGIFAEYGGEKFFVVTGLAKK